MIKRLALLLLAGLWALTDSSAAKEFDEIYPTIGRGIRA
jgi:hypothetical protein